MTALAVLDPAAAAPSPERHVSTLEVLRDLGRSAMTEGDDALAESCWHVALRLAPSDPWAGHNRAVCLMRMGRLDEAERQYGEQSRAFPAFMPSCRGRAQVAIKQGRNQDALAHFEQALVLAPEHFETHLDCLSCCLALSRPEDARRHLAAAAAIRPGDIRLRDAEAALAHVGEAQPAPATPAPPLAEAVATLARLAAKRGEREQAMALWLRAVELKPDDLWVRNELGHFAVDRGDLARAEALFVGIAEAQPDFFHAARGLARIAKARGDLVAALGHFARAAEIEPEDPWMPCEIAQLEAKLGRGEAGERLRGLIARRPDFAPAYQALARLVSDPAEARALLEAASALNPEDPWLRFDVARARRTGGDGAGAESLLRDLSHGGPASVAAGLELYHLLRERGDDRAAADLLRESLKANPGDSGLLIAEAERLRTEGLIDEAEAIYDDLARRDLAPYWRRIGKGLVVKRRGLVAEARDWFVQAIAIEPVEAAAYSELCALVVTEAEAEDMRRRLDRWIAAAPQLFAARAQKARFLSQRSDPGGALAEWRAIAERWPNKPEVLVEMAREHERVGEGDAARQQLEAAAALDGNHPALLEAQARHAEWRDDLDGACGLMARALAVAPGRRWLRPQSARLLFMAGRPDEAFATLDDFAADPDLEYQRIDMLRQTGRLAEAVEASRAAQRRFDAHFRLRWQGACLDVDLGRFDEAARAGRTIKPANRWEAAGCAFLAGYGAMAQWEFAAARGHLEAACAANPEDGWALNRLIHCHLMLFDLEAARASLQALAKLNRSLNQIKGKSTAYSQTHYGQIFDEFRLDAEALAETSRALKIDDDEARLGALRACVRAYPHYTPAAIAALVACRRAGLLAGAAMAEPKTSAISPSVAQFWDAAEPPADLDPYLRSWREQNPGFAYRRFDAQAAESELEGPALQAYRRAEQPAMRADIFRLAHLLRHGGVYADADDRCQTSLAPLRGSGASLVVYQEDLGSIGNNFQMATANHPVIAGALQDAARAVEEGSADLLWLSTGPGAMTRALAGYLFADEGGWRERLAGVRILDRSEMLAYVAIHCHAGYKTTEKHWSRTAFGRSASPRRR